MNNLAAELNKSIQSARNAAFDLLSRRGRNIYFPSRGILGQSAEAKGKGINATIGTATEEDGSPLCLECLEELVKLDSSAFLYAPSYGLPELRAKWKDMLVSKNPSLQGKTFSLPVVTNALTHGLSVAGYLFMDEGATILLPDLYWDNYDLVFNEAYGTTMQHYETFTPDGFNVAGLRQALLGEGEKKIAMLNFPNNPAGYTITHQEADALCEALLAAAEAGKKIVALLDDAYFGLTYESAALAESLFPRLIDLHPNLLAVKLDGPTKEDYVWGLRCGFISFGIKHSTPEQLKALESKAGGVVRGSISNTPNIGQRMLLNAYDNPAYAEQKKVKYDVLFARYKRIRSILEDHPEYAESFSPMPFNSGYFMCVKLNGADPEAVRKLLLEEFDTGVIVLSGLIRLAFSSVPGTKLPDLFSNLHQAVQRLRQ